MTRFLTITATLLAVTTTLPSAALAQAAAGTVPNTFDRPSVGQTPAPQTASPTASAAVQPLSPTPVNTASEDALRAIIASLQTGTPDYSLLTDDLATQMRAQATTILPLMQGFGAVQSLDFVGSRSGADIFVVNFANAETEWMVGMQADSKIAALLFRPADGSAASAPAPSAPQ